VLDAVLGDIRPHAVKIGMVPNAGIVEVIAEKLQEYRLNNIVLDPVMVSTSGARLITLDAISALKTCLIPLADVITPNLYEVEVLLGFLPQTPKDMERAGYLLVGAGVGAGAGAGASAHAPDKGGCTRADKAHAKGAVQAAYALIKGGHTNNSADDVLIGATLEKPRWFKEQRVNTKNTHGTGCTLSSALACNLALGFDMETSVKNAKDYVTGALQHNPGLGKGSGPLDHMWQYRTN
jgi:hydroxymethylpyrimidine/phosphomethylpyrimidine kinase